MKLMNCFIYEQIEEATIFQDTMDQIKWSLKMKNYTGIGDFWDKD